MHKILIIVFVGIFQVYKNNFNELNMFIRFWLRTFELQKYEVQIDSKAKLAFIGEIKMKGEMLDEIYISDIYFRQHMILISRRVHTLRVCVSAEQQNWSIQLKMIYELAYMCMTRCCQWIKTRKSTTCNHMGLGMTTSKCKNVTTTEKQYKQPSSVFAVLCKMCFVCRILSHQTHRLSETLK